MHLLLKPASGNCNMRCKYCFYTDEMEKREVPNYGFMSQETLETIVQKALQNSHDSCTFAFQGGEPTLIGLDFYRKLIEMEERYNTKRIPIFHALQTNGYHLTREWADFLHEHHFLVGLSVDGIKPVHDAYRVDSSGRGTFTEVMKTAELFDQAQVDYNILTVVNRRTAERIPRIYEFYKKNNWMYQQYIACLDPYGEEKGIEDYSLMPQMYGKFLIQLFDLWYMDLMKGCQPNIRMFENYIGILMGYPAESCDQRGCCAIQYVVEADGSVYPCDFYVMDEYRIGNFLTDAVEEINERANELEFVKTSMNKPETCRTCSYFQLCRGGCRRHRDEILGMTLGENYFCESYRMFFDAALPRMKQIARMLQMQKR